MTVLSSYVNCSAVVGKKRRIIIYTWTVHIHFSWHTSKITWTMEVSLIPRLVFTSNFLFFAVWVRERSC